MNRKISKINYVFIYKEKKYKRFKKYIKKYKLILILNFVINNTGIK